MRIFGVFFWLLLAVLSFHHFVPETFSYDESEFYALDHPLEESIEEQESNDEQNIEEYPYDDNYNS